MRTWEVNNIQQGQYTELLSSSWVVLLGAYDSPPHIGLVSNGKVYKASVYSTQIGNSLVALEKLIQKGLPILAIELGPSLNTSEIENYFKNFNLKSHPEQTCFIPVKQSIEAITGIDLPEKAVIFDFLNHTYFENSQSKVIAFNIESDKLALQVYDHDFVLSHIQQILMIKAAY